MSVRLRRTGQSPNNYAQHSAIFHPLSLSLSLSLFLHLADCRVAFAHFPCSRALASALIEECDDRTNEREMNVSAREERRKIEIWREKIATGITYSNEEENTK